jgi:hypothetical protein
MESYNKLKYGKFKTADGTIGYYLDRGGKKQLHNSDGPAFIPQGDRKLAEWHVFGMPMSEKDFDYWQRNFEGIPDYKKFQKAGNRGE